MGLKNKQKISTGYRNGWKNLYLVSSLFLLDRDWLLEWVNEVFLQVSEAFWWIKTFWKLRLPNENLPSYEEDVFYTVKENEIFISYNFYACFKSAVSFWGEYRREMFSRK